MFLLRREQGVLADLEPIAGGAIESHPGLKRFLAAIALARAESGRIAEARERLNRLISNDLLDEVAETSEQLE